MHRRPPNTIGRYEIKGGLFAVCAQIVLKCFWQELDDQILLWSVGTLTRSATTWNKACDKRLLRLINYINQTKNTGNCVVWETRLKLANWVHSKMLHLQGFTGFNINIRRCVLCVF